MKRCVPCLGKLKVVAPSHVWECQTCKERFYSARYVRIAEAWAEVSERFKKTFEKLRKVGQ